MANRRTVFFYATVACMVLIVYGSLLPFEIRSKSLSEGWEIFRHIPYLQLSIQARADWIANIILYVPFAFFACGWLAGREKTFVHRLGRIAMLLTVGMLLAVTVEFTQIWFEPRTVSLNDIIAEIIGIIIGIILWESAGARLVALAQKIVGEKGLPAVQSAAVIYALVYLALSLFPFDFTTSADILAAKFSTGYGHWLLAACRNQFICAMKLVAEVLAVVPLGALLSIAFKDDRRWTWCSALYTGLALGVILEGFQFFLASGISQGISILSRGVGTLLGMVIYRRLSWHYLTKALPYIRPSIIIAAVPYGITLLALNGWFSHPWLGWTEAEIRIAALHFMPFYYHYYTTETVAVVSVLFQFGLYFPIGVAAWFWCWRMGENSPHSVLVAVIAAVTASTVETGKLFLEGQHSDPTNVLIAAASAMVAYQIVKFLHRTSSTAEFIQATPHERKAAVSGYDVPLLDPVVVPPRRPLHVIAGAVLLVAAVVAVTDPFKPLLIIFFFLCYAALLWLKPGTWPIWVLALLPLLDFAPYSGRMYWSEFDTLLLVTLGICYLRISPGPLSHFRRTGVRLLAAFTASAGLALAIGLWPLAPLDQNAFANYMSPYNALRAAKGLFFALTFLPLLARQWEDPLRTAHRFALGMTLGVIAEIMYVLWERATFSGLLNFATDYRITGSFPGMHIGGAYIECYLATTLPFVLLWAWQRRQLAATLLAVGVYSLGAYSVMVTFSRGGEAAFILTTLIAAFGFARIMLHNRRRRLLSLGAVALFIGAAFAVAWPIVTGKFNESRLATVHQDIRTRVAHWQDALQIVSRDHDYTWGKGLGSFPAAYFWGSRAATRPATYTFQKESGNVFLRLGSGELLYFEQMVNVEPERDYTLALDLRSDAAAAVLTVPVCEKALLTSFRCDWNTVRLTTAPGQWGHYRIHVRTKRFGPPGSRFSRPVKLSIFNGRKDTVVDVDNVTLTNAVGQSLLVNGDFNEGMSHWFFSTDSHLAWHTKNLFVHVLFEQGWVGLSLFVMLLGYTLAHAFKRGWHNDPLGVALFASLSAFFVVGLVDSLIDETRIGFLFFMLLNVGLLIMPPRWQAPA